MGPPPRAPPPTVSMDLAFATYIPKNYIPVDRHRMEVYRKIAVAKSNEDIEQIRGELADVYGPIPEEVELLLELGRLRIGAGKLGIKTIVTSEQNLIFSFAEDASAKAESLFKNAAGKMRIVEDRTVYLRLEKNYFEPRTLINVLRKVLHR